MAEEGEALVAGVEAEILGEEWIRDSEAILVAVGYSITAIALA